jgi:hypothetical protein
MMNWDELTRPGYATLSWVGIRVGSPGWVTGKLIGPAGLHRRKIRSRLGHAGESKKSVDWAS